MACNVMVTMSAAIGAAVAIFTIGVLCPLLFLHWQVSKLSWLYANYTTTVRRSKCQNYYFTKAFVIEFIYLLKKIRAFPDQA